MRNADGGATRPADWAPLGAHDPLPGDPLELSSEGRRLAGLAADFERQAASLRAIAAEQTLRGDYVTQLHEGAAKGADGLTKIVDRYRVAGGALSAYAPQLQSYQDTSLKLLERAQTAQAELMAHQRVVDSLAPAVALRKGAEITLGTPATPSEEERQKIATQQRANQAEDAELAAAQARVARAQGDLEEVRAELRRLIQQRDADAQSAARRIEEASDDGVTDSWWENVQDTMHAHKAELDEASEVLTWIGVGIFVVTLFVPGLGEAELALLAASAAVGTLSMGVDTASAIGGDKSWSQVGIDAVALVTLGLGKFLGPGIKIGERTFGGALAKNFARYTEIVAEEAAQEAEMAVRATTRSSRVLVAKTMNAGGALARTARKADFDGLRRVTNIMAIEAAEAARTRVIATSRITVPGIIKSTIAFGDSLPIEVAVGMARTYRSFSSAAASGIISKLIAQIAITQTANAFSFSNDAVNAVKAILGEVSELIWRRPPQARAMLVSTLL